MHTISLCMIVKNEEDVLEGCLKSIHDLVDEIVILDTGSTDRTKEIAGKFTERVYDFEWIDDFSAARNAAFAKAEKDFILWLDADDVLLEADREKFRQVKETLDDTVDAVSMYYHTAFDEYGNPTFKFRRNRIVKRANQFKWHGPVHEYLEVGGNIIQSDIAVTHRKHQKENLEASSGRNLKIYENRLKKGETFTPRDLFYYANELKDHGTYQKAILYYDEFLATRKGWVEDEIRACIYMADCYRNLYSPHKEREALARSIQYDVPRPEVSCRFGDYYKNNNQFKKAAIWYELALRKDTDDDHGFNLAMYSTWYPHLQLCVCHWQLGDLERAAEHNALAKTYRPDDPRVIYNEKIFKELDTKKS